jgi:hypothetical protein
MIFISEDIKRSIDKLWPTQDRPQLPYDIALVSKYEDKPKAVLSTHCILITREKSIDDGIAAAVQHGIQLIIPLEHPHFAFMMDQSFQLLQGSVNFLNHLGPMFLPQTENFLPTLAEFNTLPKKIWTIETSQGKPGILDDVRDTLDAQQATRILTQPAVQIIDELLMNALYDAPREAGFSEDTAAPVHAFMVSDRNLLVLGCIDTFGSLKTQKLMVRLNKVQTEGMGPAMNLGPGGAGLGLKIVLDQSMDFLAVCEKGRKTTVLITLPLGFSRKKMANLNRSFRLIEFPTNN